MPRRAAQAEPQGMIQTVEDLERAKRALAEQAAEFWRAVKSLDDFEPTESALSQAQRIVKSEIQLPDDYAPSKPLADALSELAVVLARAIAGRGKLAQEKALPHPFNFEQARAKLMELTNTAIIAGVESTIRARLKERDFILDGLRQLVHKRIQELKKSVQPEVWELYLALERRTPNTPRETPLECAAALTVYVWADRIHSDPILELLDKVTDGEASRTLQRARTLETQVLPGRILGADFWAPLA